jgi:hypothetical protein
MAPLSLPDMGIGENLFTYTDESPAERRVRITHEWVERSASAPPRAPQAPIRPRDGGDADGTDVVFEWQPASDPDGDAVADYHFELSPRADMRWPLSMTFARLISRTNDAGSARFALTAPGELNPDREYYWHVRAKDAQGVWGPWSATWRFTPRGPTPPLHVTLDYDAETNLGTLRWRPNPMGSHPVAYRIYASDEKGFSVSDESFTVAAGIYDFERKSSTPRPTQFPPNFLVETRATELVVAGPGVQLPGANKSYYRVVAVDESQRKSGPSDYAAALRPVIYSQPVLEARTGAEYRYQLAAIRSIGDLRTRVVDGREVMNYWDLEKPRYSIEQGPSWLAIDPSTGQLSGTPDRAGRWEVTVAVQLERERRNIDAGQLQWGIERVTGIDRETVGSAKQAFVIESR